MLRTEVNLTDDDLGEEAKKQFKNHTVVQRTLELNARCVFANDQLSPIGRHLVCLTLENNYSNYKKVLNYVASRPELIKPTNPIPHPIFLCGLPRSGTTLLYNLLACDPAGRAPLYLDMMDPIPPLRRSDVEAQTKRNSNAKELHREQYQLGLAEYEKDIQASHPSYAHERDQFVLGHTGYLWLNCMLVPNKDCDFMKWLLSESDKDFVYEYHKMFFEMLNVVDPPKSHWVFKTGMHLIQLDTLLHYYPTASIIVNHRRLQETLPSCARVALAFVGAYFDKNKPSAVAAKNKAAELILEVMDVLIRRLVEFQRKNKHTPFFGVRYENLVTQPIETVRKIYQQFGLPWSDEFEQAMVVWLRENPVGRYGRNTYSLEEFGLDSETIDKRYEEYNEIFNYSQKQSKAD